MKVELISDKSELSKEGDIYVITYKPLKYKESSQIKLEISDIELKDISARAGCASCTTVSTKINQDSVTLNISYDTKHLGNFDKRVSFFHQGQLTQFKIKGTVTQ
jgi:hypothetical protein